MIPAWTQHIHTLGPCTARSQPSPTYLDSRCSYTVNLKANSPEPAPGHSVSDFDGARPAIAPDAREVPAQSRARRWLYISLGCVFVALGAVGVVLPGIPTTPFLLLASFFLVRSSPRLHRKMLASKTFGPILADWNRHRGLRRGVKRIAVVSCSLMIGISVLFGGLPRLAQMLVVAAGAYGIWFVARLPVVPDRRTS